MGVMRRTALAVALALGVLPALPARAAPADGAQRCAISPFGDFFDAYLRDPAVRMRHTAPSVRLVSEGDEARVLSREAYARSFPLRMAGRHYETAGPGKASGRRVTISTSYRTGPTRPVPLPDGTTLSGRRSDVDWAEARFDAEHEALVAEITDTPNRLVFAGGADDCWQLVEDVRGAARSPLRPGPQRLTCRLRGDRFAQFHQDSRRHNRDDALGCMVLQSRIEAALAQDAELAALDGAIRQRIERLGADNPVFSEPLEMEQRRFRRSLMREVDVLVDEEAMTPANRQLLKEQLERHLARVRRIVPGRSDPVGRWWNTTGSFDIVRAGDGYAAEGSTVDPEYLGWTCEFTGGFRREGGRLWHEAPDGGQIAAQVKDSLLLVEHEGATEYCGSNGSLSGIYFPIAEDKR